MTSVLWEIIVPLLVAFGIGLLVGWLLWRWRRTKVTPTEWERLTSAANGAEQRAAALMSERDDLSRRVAALSAGLEASESATGALRSELDAAEGRLGSSATEHAQTAARVHELETKLEEAAVRAEGLEQGQREARARSAERDGEMAELRARAKRSATELDGLRAELAERDRALKAAKEQATSALDARASRAESDAESARLLAKRLDAELGDARRGASAIEGDLLAARARIEELEALVSSGPASSTAAVGFVGPETASEHEPKAPTRRAPGDVDDGEPDNLQLIDGVGPKLEQFLHKQGITSFGQLAALDEAGVDALQAELREFPGRIERERWVPQAQEIVSGTTSVRVVPKSQRDDLKRIKGVGPVLERWLHGCGIYRFVDLVALDEKAVAELSSRLEDFPGRIEREEWIAQARILARDKTSA